MTTDPSSTRTHITEHFKDGDIYRITIGNDALPTSITLKSTQWEDGNLPSLILGDVPPTMTRGASEVALILVDPKGLQVGEDYCVFNTNAGEFRKIRITHPLTPRVKESGEYDESLQLLEFIMFQDNGFVNQTVLFVQYDTSNFYFYSTRVTETSPVPGPGGRYIVPGSSQDRAIQDKKDEIYNEAPLDEELIIAQFGGEEEEEEDDLPTEDDEGYDDYTPHGSSSEDA